MLKIDFFNTNITYYQPMSQDLINELTYALKISRLRVESLEATDAAHQLKANEQQDTIVKLVSDQKTSVVQADLSNKTIAELSYKVQFLEEALKRARKDFANIYDQLKK